MKLPQAVVPISRSLLTKIIDKDFVLDSGTRMWYWYRGSTRKMVGAGDFFKSFLCSFSITCLLFSNFYVCQTIYIYTHLCIHAHIHMHTHIFSPFPTNDLFLLKWLYGFVEFSTTSFMHHTNVWNLEYDCLWLNYFKSFHNFYAM